MFDAHFRKKQAEGHRQDDQDGCCSIGDRLDDELLRCLWAERDEVDHSAGHSEQGDQPRVADARGSQRDTRSGEIDRDLDWRRNCSLARLPR
jgi:hypothetical protein